MNVSFSDKKLEQCSEDGRYCIKYLGSKRAKIFEPHEEPIPTDKSGKYIWLEIRGVEVIEITNYHGK